MARSIMIQGTMSNAGKSLLVGGLLRVMKQVGDYCFQGSANPLEFHDRRN